MRRKKNKSNALGWVVGIALAAGAGLLWYYKPWNQKSKDPYNLTDAEKRQIAYLMEGGLNYTYKEALDKVLFDRLEDKGKSGWSEYL